MFAIEPNNMRKGYTTTIVCFTCVICLTRRLFIVFGPRTQNHIASAFTIVLVTGMQRLNFSRLTDLVFQASHCER